MYSRPAEPMPQGRPRLAPFLVVQTGPFGPSVTNGIRSLHSAGALVTKRSGGSQQRSMWQSAEIISYRIGEPPPPDERLGPAQSYPIRSGSARLMRPLAEPSSPARPSARRATIAFSPRTSHQPEPARRRRRPRPVAASDSPLTQEITAFYGATASARRGEPVAPWILSGVSTSSATWTGAAESPSRFAFSTM